VDYLKRAELMDALERLRFNLVGFGCTTCIGNSGPLEEHVAQAVDENGLVVSAVLSGNRNFEGRIHPQVRAAYLASPPLVVAYALAGTVDIDMRTEPLGLDKNGDPVFLADVWPSSEEISAAVDRAVSADIFKETYSHIFDGEERWAHLKVPQGALYEWDPNSTYLREPPFVQGMPAKPPGASNITAARVLAMVGDSVTTDHISPAGSIAPDSPAAIYLEERGTSRRDFNSYGSRRGNHEVMMRGTFANVRFKNELAPDLEGGWTQHLPDGEEIRIYDAAMRYREEGVPLLVIAGQEYGTGSSRDWAAKGSALLGVRAVIAESWERIHRSNLIGMGVLPLEFLPGEGRKSLELTGEELYDVEGLARGIKPRMTVKVRATADDGSEKTFEAVVRVDSALEAEQYRHGGILPMIVRRLVGS
jgi:aconitate hydratase